MQQFRNLVFKGGGVKGVAYIGAISVLEEMDLIRGVLRTCGTSSGAIMAAHIALGGAAAQLADLMTSRFLGGLLDGSAWPVRDLGRLVRDFGWYPGRRLSLWMKRHMEQLSGRQDITFAQLERLHARRPEKYKHLTVIATDVTHQCPQVFDASRTPNVPVWQALRASMSIPFLFAAPRGEKGEVLSDGGLVWNYPLNLYDDPKWLTRPEDHRLFDIMDSAVDHARHRLYNKETLGFMAETRNTSSTPGEAGTAGAGDIAGFSAYLKAMIGLMTDNTASAYLNLPDWQRTVFIEAHGVRATDFAIPDATIKTLLDSGRKAAQDYFTWFENPAHSPMNRIALSA